MKKTTSKFSNFYFSKIGEIRGKIADILNVYGSPYNIINTIMIIYKDSKSVVILR